jgi:hypothetical protein
VYIQSYVDIIFFHDLSSLMVAITLLKKA